MKALFLALSLSLLFLLGFPVLAQQPDNQSAMMGRDINGNWQFLHLDAVGNTLMATSPSTGSTTQAAMPSDYVAAMGRYPSGAWGYLNLDASGNLLVNNGGGSGGGSGTVTSVGAPPLYNVTSASTAPTFTLIPQAAHTVLAGPATGTTNGTPGYRALVVADIPSLTTLYDASGAAATVQGTSLQKANNLSDLTSVPTALNNLGIGNATTTTAGLVKPDGSTITVTNGVISATSSGGSAPTITPSVGGPLTATPTSTFSSLSKVSQLFIGGDSYARGAGVYDYANTWAGKLQRDTPAPIHNRGISGSISASYVNQAMANFDPDPNLTSVSVWSGLENDSQYDTCGGTTGTNCYKQALLNETALVGWMTIPFTNRMMASKCVQTSGYWGAASTAINGGTLPTYTMQQAPGTMMEGNGSFTASGVMTCTIATTTATSIVGVNYLVVNGSPVTFTVTVDGTAQTDMCSGTTTFSATPCQYYASETGTYNIYRQEYTVTPATSHVVVFSFSGSTLQNQVGLHSIDWIVPNSASNNVFFQFAEGPFFQYATLYSNLTKTLLAKEATEGLATNYIDATNGVTVGGTTYSVNGTTDIATAATATCSGAIVANHPNTCGNTHYEQTLQAAEYSAVGPTGSTPFVFSSPNLEAGPSSANEMFFETPPFVKENNVSITAASSISLNIGGVSHVTGTTAINSMIPPPGCSVGLTACFVTLIFDTAGATINSTTATNGFYAPVNVSTAGTAITFVEDSNLRWYPTAPALNNQVLTIASSATPALVGLNGFETVTLTANATPTISGIAAGQRLTLQVCQNATGGYTWTPPTALHSAITSATIAAMPASTCAIQTFEAFTATDMVADSGGNTGVTP